jgi:hypothetical protein
MVLAQSTHYFVVATAQQSMGAPGWEAHSVMALGLPPMRALHKAAAVVSEAPAAATLA